MKGATIVEKVTGEGSLRFLLDIYEDATYVNKVVNFPFQSTLNANINMQVLCEIEKFVTHRQLRFATLSLEQYVSSEIWILQINLGVIKMEYNFDTLPLYSNIFPKVV